MQAQFDDFLHTRRIQHRDHRGVEGVLALVGQRRRLAGMVVTGNQQDTAVFRGAGGIGVLEHIPAAVYAGALAIPHGKHAVVFGSLEQAYLLRSPDGGGGEFFIDAGLEMNVVLFEVLFGFPQRLIKTTQRRTAIAGDKTGGVESGGKVALALDHGEADEGLDAGEIDAAGIKCVLVVQRDG